MNIKKLRLIIPIIVTYAFYTNAFSAISIGGGGTGNIELQTSCEEVTCPSDLNPFPAILPETDACVAYSSIKCYKKSGTTYHFKPCTQCKSPYTLTNKQRKECSAVQGMLSGPSLPQCECICDNCTSSTAWSANGTGYEKYTTKSCDCSGTVATCQSSTRYQCAAGYYGSSSNGTSGCAQCPTWSGVYTNSAKTSTARGTSTAGTTTITGCYIPSGTYYDATGTFTLTGSCNYK